MRMRSDFYEWIKAFHYYGGFVKTFTATAEDKQKWWDGLSESDKSEVKALPNFDADKFCKCVGIEHI